MCTENIDNEIGDKTEKKKNELRTTRNIQRTWKS